MALNHVLSYPILSCHDMFGKIGLDKMDLSPLHHITPHHTTQHDTSTALHSAAHNHLDLTSAAAI